MVIGVPRETRPDERRVAATPETVHKLIGKGHQVLVERGAGLASFFPDHQYETAGARIVDTREAFGEAELVLKVLRPRATDAHHEADLLREGAWVVSFLYGHEDADAVARLRAREATVLAMEAVPRIARAQ